MNETLVQKDVNFQNGLQSHIQNIPTLAQSAPQTAGFAAPILTIPVVVHVIHAPNDLVGQVGQNTNLTIAQVQSQIDKLNQVFRKNDPNFANTPAVFQNLATDADIEFCLANTDLCPKLKERCEILYWLKSGEVSTMKEAMVLKTGV